MALPEVKITKAEGDDYNARTTTVELELPDGSSLDITNWTTRIEQLRDTRAVKLTLYAHADIDPSDAIIIDVHEEFGVEAPK